MDTDWPIVFTDASQFSTLANYAQVIGTAGSFYWIGYEFTAANNFSDIPSEIETVLLEAGNYGTEEQAPAGPGVCLAMGQDGLLYRRPCLSELPGFCYQRFNSESHVLSR